MIWLLSWILESLRKWPPVTSTSRICNKNYKISGSNFTIQKGTQVFIPIYAIHHDPEYYPNPNEYNPDNFSVEEVQKRNSFTFLPFGEGPRICIGLRFGMMQARLGLLTLIKNFKFTLGSKTEVPVKISPGAIVLSIEGGLWLNIEEIKT